MTHFLLGFVPNQRGEAATPAPVTDSRLLTTPERERRDPPAGFIRRRYWPGRQLKPVQRRIPLPMSLEDLS